MEMEAWHDLANVYISLSQWRDAELCLSKSKAISPFSATRWYSTGTRILRLCLADKLFLMFDVSISNVYYIKVAGILFSIGHPNQLVMSVT